MHSGTWAPQGLLQAALQQYFGALKRNLCQAVEHWLEAAQLRDKEKGGGGGQHGVPEGLLHRTFADW